MKSETIYTIIIAAMAAVVGYFNPVTEPVWPERPEASWL